MVLPGLKCVINNNNCLYVFAQRREPLRSANAEVGEGDGSMGGLYGLHGYFYVAGHY